MLPLPEVGWLTCGENFPLRAQPVLHRVADRAPSLFPICVGESCNVFLRCGDRLVGESLRQSGDSR